MSDKDRNLPYLTKENFPRFRDAFRDWALSQGKAGQILQGNANVDLGFKGDRDLRQPTFDIMDPPHVINAAGNAVDAAGNAVGIHRRYANNNTGFTICCKDEERYTAYQDAKLRIISKLLSLMDTEVHSQVETQPGWAAAVAAADLVNIWQLTQVVCLGQGAASIYNVTSKLMTLKQGKPENWPTHYRNWQDLNATLMRFHNGNHQLILNAILDTLFVFSVNQDQFKEQLTPIYGNNQIPAHAVLGNTLNTYFQNTENMKSLLNEKKEGTYATKDDYNDYSDDYVCFNCGGKHQRKDCTKPGTKCTKCFRFGHMGKFCEKLQEMLKRKYQSPSNHYEDSGKNSGVPYQKKKPPQKGGQKGEFKDKKNVKMKKTNVRFMKKNKNKHYLAQENEDSQAEDDEDYEEDDDYEEEDFDDEDEEAQFNAVTILKEFVEEDKQCEVCYKASHLVVGSVRLSLDEIIFLMDTGCRGLHITKYSYILSNLMATKIKVTGITRNTLPAQFRGHLPLFGDTLVLEDADANLFSVRKAVQVLGGSYDGDTDCMNIRDADGQIILKGITNREGGRGEFDDYYTCTAADIVHAAKLVEKKRSLKIFPVFDEQEATIVKRHFTPEQRARALRAWKLCYQLGHAGHDKIAKDLDNGAHPECDLTSVDVKNGVELYGPCPACPEGKMNNPTEPPSTTPPAEKIGEHLHIDLIKLKSTCIGGYTQLLVAVDEKSGFVSIIPTLNKSTAQLCEAESQLIKFYNQYGHTVSKITSDGENNLKSTKQFLAGYKIEYNFTPAEHHEKRVERYIQTLKKRKMAILASLDYELPDDLEAEAFIAAAHSMNSSSCKVSAPYTPYHLVTGKKVIIPVFYFGQTGLFKGVTKDKSAVWGIFIGYNNAPNSLRAYIPSTQGGGRIVSRRKFEPHNSYPKEWKLLPRIHNKDPQRQQDTPKEVDQMIQQTIPPPPADLIDTSSDALPSQVNQLINSTANQQVEVHKLLEALNILPPHNNNNQTTSVIGNNQSAAPIAAPSSIATPVPAATINPAPTVIDNVSPSSVPQSLSESAQEDRVSTRPVRAAAQHKGWLHGRRSYSATPSSETSDKISTLQAYLSVMEKLYKAKQPTSQDDLLLHAYRVSFGQALKMRDRKEQIDEALLAEIDNIMQNKVVKPIKPSRITKDIHARTVPAHMFFKFKYKADGSFDKVKARLVANGDQQNPDFIGETYAHTVNPISVKTQLQITATEGMYLSAYDIKGAFLLSKLDKTKDELIYIRVPSNVSSYWVKQYPHLQDYLSDKGCLTFELQRYIYGLAESPHKFNKLFDSTIKSLGFKQSKADPCMYILKAKTGKIIVSDHVDDMLVSCSTLKLRKWFEKEMSKSFDLVAQRDNNISYLGMSIIYDRSEKLIQINQDGMLNDLLAKYNCDKHTKGPKTPVTAAILIDPATISDNPVIDRKEFLSLNMTLMYLARFTRHDILFPVVTLATRSSKPRRSDMQHAIRVLRYLAVNRGIGPIFDGKVPLVANIFADASHCLHFTGHGQGGIIITLGSAPIHIMSFKLKLITRSSSESELVVLEEASTFAVWLKLLLFELDVITKGDPIKIYQDNLSTIFIATEGGKFKRSKHLLTRESYVRERIECGDIVLEHKPTSDMCADFLTKPLSSSKLFSYLEFLRLIM